MKQGVNDGSFGFRQWCGRINQRLVSCAGRP
ncbi:Uncharacterised protein [Vibrio cholerae]|nr:Uncharacterised protein [Vibrio cholerae]